ncbi:MAG TPA: hypothetical protein VKU01_00750 [Bryobacteraceae bacterium]|nr:hypothetical protein [Bryobacteraceae bacterium]
METCRGVLLDDRPARGEARDEREGRPYGVTRDVGDDAEPGEECRLVAMESRGCEDLIQRLSLEIRRRERQTVRQRNSGVRQQLPLPGLGVRMVNFDYAQAFAERIAIGVRVEAGSENHKLVHAPFDGRGQGVLGETMAHSDEHAHSPPGSAFLGRAGDSIRVVLSQDAQRERVGEDVPLFEHLVRGAMERGGPGGPAWFSRLHGSRIPG